MPQQIKQPLLSRALQILDPRARKKAREKREAEARRALDLKVKASPKRSGQRNQNSQLQILEEGGNF